MTVSNEEIMKCMADLFVLWRQGQIMSAEAIGHAMYVVGGYLVMTSGHGGRMASGDLSAAIQADPILSKTIEEFIYKEGNPNERSLAAGGDFLARLTFVIQILLTYIVRWMKDQV